MTMDRQNINLIFDTQTDGNNSNQMNRIETTKQASNFESFTPGDHYHDNEDDNNILKSDRQAVYDPTTNHNHQKSSSSISKLTSPLLTTTTTDEKLIKTSSDNILINDDQNNDDDDDNDHDDVHQQIPLFTIGNDINELSSSDIVDDNNSAERVKDNLKPKLKTCSSSPVIFVGDQINRQTFEHSQQKFKHRSLIVPSDQLTTINNEDKINDHHMNDESSLEFTQDHSTEPKSTIDQIKSETANDSSQNTIKIKLKIEDNKHSKSFIENSKPNLTTTRKQNIEANQRKMVKVIPTSPAPKVTLSSPSPIWIIDQQLINHNKPIVKSSIISPLMISSNCSSLSTNIKPIISTTTATIANTKRRSNHGGNFLMNILPASTYRQKHLEFERLFHRNLTTTTTMAINDEILICDYYCALNAIQGRIYVSKNHFAFHYNIMGMFAKSLIWNCSDIISISRANTALVIPNAIQLVVKSSPDDKVEPIANTSHITLVTTLNSTNVSSTPPSLLNDNGTQKYLFTSFTQRDKAHSLMETVWKRSISGRPLSNEEISDIVHKLYGEHLGFQTDEEVARFFSDQPHQQPQPQTMAKTQSSDNYQQQSTENETTKFAISSNNDSLLTPDSSDTLQQRIVSNVKSCNLATSLEPKIEPQPQPVQNDKNVDNSPDSTIAVMTTSSQPSSSSEMAASIESPPKSLNRFFKSATMSMVEGRCRCTQHKGTLMLEKVLPFPVDYLFELIFIDSSFSRYLYKIRQTTSVKISPWMGFNEKDRPNIPLPDGDYDIDHCEYRNMKYTVKVNGLPLVKSCVCQETQFILQSDLNRAYCMFSQIKNYGIPYSDCFVASSTWCLNSCLPENNNEQQNMDDSTNLHDDNDLLQDNKIPTLPTHTKLLIHFNIHYIKSSYTLAMMKSTIEKNSIQGFKEYLDDLLKLIRSNRFDFMTQQSLFTSGSGVYPDGDASIVDNQPSISSTMPTNGTGVDLISTCSTNTTIDTTTSDHSSFPFEPTFEFDDSEMMDSTTPEFSYTTAIINTLAISSNFIMEAILNLLFPMESDSRLLKVVFIMLVVIIVINWCLLGLLDDIETRLNLIIDLIQESKTNLTIYHSK